MVETLMDSIKSFFKSIFNNYNNVNGVFRHFSICILYVRIAKLDKKYVDNKEYVEGEESIIKKKR